MLNFRALRTSKNFKIHWCPPCGQNVTSPEGILPGWLCPLCHILLDFPKYVRMDSSLYSHASSVRRHSPPDIFEVPSMAGNNEKMTEMTWWWFWTWLKMMPGTFAIGEFPSKLTNEVVMLLLEIYWWSPKLIWHLRSGWIVVMRVILGPTSP